MPENAASKAKTFRDRAEECLALADTAGDVEVQQSYRRMAASYQQIADDYEFIARSELPEETSSTAL